MSTYPFTTQAQVRGAFWEAHPQYQRKGGQSQNSYNADIRMAFCDFVEHLARDRSISETLAGKVNL